MIQETEIIEAVDVQLRTYRLLKWLETAIERGFVSSSRAHDFTSASDVAVEWLREHYHNFPDECRPVLTNDDAIRKFANMFSSYLLTSFEIPDKPEYRLMPTCSCMCPFCSHVVATSNLRPKKLSGRDRKRANKLKVDCLKQLALDSGVQVTADRLVSIVDDPEESESVAMATYGDELVKRLRGHLEGPAVLALWRQFAWNRDGSPKKKFKLSADAVLDCQNTLINRLSNI